MGVNVHNHDGSGTCSSFIVDLGLFFFSLLPWVRVCMHIVYGSWNGMVASLFFFFFLSAFTIRESALYYIFYFYLGLAC